MSLQPFLQPFMEMLAVGTAPEERVIDFAISSAFILIGAVTIEAVYISALMLVMNLRGRKNVKQSQAFGVARPNGKRILLVGDSTAFGTGAAAPEESIAGRLAHDFPGTEIVNNAINGAVTQEVPAQIDKASGQRFDLILVFTGGNDIWRFTNLAKVKQSLEEVIGRTITMSDHRVIVLFYANFGLSPIFPSFLRRPLERRTARVREVFSEVCRGFSVPVVELYTARATDAWSNPFSDDPKTFFSSDYVHPSSEGYRLWYNRMWREMVEHGYTFEERHS